MSNYSFSNENIFTIPIDQYEDNTNNIPNEIDNTDNNPLKLNESEIKTDTSISDYKTDESDFDNSPKNISEIYFSIFNVKKRNEDYTNEYNNTPRAIAYSSIKDDKQIKSLTDSSKLYVCEFMAYNWKNKIRRFVINNKIKYIEIIKKMEE